MINYRLATINDIDTLINMRLAQLKEEGAEESCDLKPYLKKYYLENLNNGTFVSYLAIDNNEVIATSGMSFASKPPYYTCKSGKIGLLSSMYTLPNYRRKGIAKKLLNMVIGEAKNKECGVIHVTASVKGVLLYESYGFKHNDRFLQYKIEE